MVGTKRARRLRASTDEFLIKGRILLRGGFGSISSEDECEILGKSRDRCQLENVPQYRVFAVHVKRFLAWKKVATMEPVQK